jgi:hypothetical protein
MQIPRLFVVHNLDPSDAEAESGQQKKVGSEIDWEHGIGQSCLLLRDL